MQYEMFLISILHANLFLDFSIKIIKVLHLQLLVWFLLNCFVLIYSHYVTMADFSRSILKVVDDIMQLFSLKECFVCTNLECFNLTVKRRLEVFFRTLDKTSPRNVTVHPCSTMHFILSQLKKYVKTYSSVVLLQEKYHDILSSFITSIKW